MEQITPTRKPLFGAAEEKLEKKVQKPVSGLRQEFKPVKGGGGESIFGNTRLLISFGVIFVAVITIVVVLMVGSNFSSEAASKSGLLLPLLWRWKIE
jgi:hypothetical protein